MAIQASHIFRDSTLGVGLGNSMGPKGSHSRGSLKIPLIERISINFVPGTPNNSNHITISHVKTLNHLIETTIEIEMWPSGSRYVSLFKFPCKWWKKLPTSTDDRRISEKSTVTMNNARMINFQSGNSWIILLLKIPGLESCLQESEWRYRLGALYACEKNGKSTRAAINLPHFSHQLTATNNLIIWNLLWTQTTTWGFWTPPNAAIQHERTPFFSKQLIHCCAATHSKPFHLTSGAAWICCHLQGCVLLPLIGWSQLKHTRTEIS